MSDSQKKSLLDAVGYQFQPTSNSYSEQDAAFYALSIGASKEALDAADLQYTYELYSGDFKCFPTFAATFPLRTMEQIAEIPGQSVNLMEVLHGEHTLELAGPLPTSGTITNQAQISQVYDKGSGAVLIVDITSEDQEGRHIATNQASIFLRGRGDFGGERGPSSRIDSPPERTADEVFAERTEDNQALLYRLASGDYNPLHVDSRFSALLGYERPILHGLCAYGFAARAIMKTMAGNDCDRFQSIKARFSRHIYPGETLQTEMWQTSDTRIQFVSRVVERDEIVLTNGVLVLKAD